MRPLLGGVLIVATVGALAVGVWIWFPKGEQEQRAVAVVAPILAAVFTYGISLTIDRRPRARVEKLSVERFDHAEFSRSLQGDQPTRKMYLYLKNVKIQLDTGDVQIDLEGRFEARRPRWGWPTWATVATTFARTRASGTGEVGWPGNQIPLTVPNEARLPRWEDLRFSLFARVAGREWKRGNPIPVPGRVVQAMNAGVPDASRPEFTVEIQP